MWLFFKILNFLLLLFSSYVWITFFFPLRFYLMTVNILMIICVLSGKIKLNYSHRVPMLAGVLLAMVILSAVVFNEISAQVLLFSFLPSILIYMLGRERQMDLLGSVTKWFSVMMLCSIAVWLMTLVTDMPNIGIFIPESIKENYDPYINYVFYISRTNLNILNRFNGPFLEPGHLAVISCMLIFANKMRFKEQPWLWVPLACVLLSLSLAGYLLLALSFVLLKMRNLVTAVGIAVFAGVAYIGVTQLWNEGRNPVNELVLSRLEYDSSKGIKGNNRTLRATDKYFTNCVKDGTIWLGVKNAQNKGNKISGAGYKIYLLRNGLVMLMLTTCFYLLLINPASNKRYAWSFVLFIGLCFLQRGYLSWYSWQLPYVLGIGISRGEMLFSSRKRRDRHSES